MKALLLLGGLVLCAAVAAALAFTSGAWKQKYTPIDIGTLLILVGGLSVTLQIVVRLCNAARFDGDAADMDFGLKCGYAHNCTAHSVAFTPEFNSFGHCLQGCLVLLFFPAVELATEWMAVTGPLRQLFGCLVVGYPVYNIVKRSIQHGDEFAASSFANNCAEWAYGFLLGLALGALLTASADHLGLKPTGRCKTWSYDRVEFWAYVLKIVAGLALWIVAFVAAIQFGLSWGNTAAKQYDSHLDAGALVGFITVPVVLGGLAALLCARGCIQICYVGPDSSAHAGTLQNKEPQTTNEFKAEVQVNHLYSDGSICT